MEDVCIDGWYALASAVVKGLEDPTEREAWREVGERIRDRLSHPQPLRSVGAARPIGHMDTKWAVPDGRAGKRTRGRRRKSEARQK